MSVFSNNGPQGASKSNVNYDGYNKWLEENIGTDQVSVTGAISGVIDLGIQPQDWSEFEANEKTTEEEASTIAYWEGKGGACYFKDGKNQEGKACRLKYVQKKPTQSFAFTVDYMDYMVPWPEFSDTIDSPKPFRQILNGKFKSELGRVYPLAWENLETDRSKDPVFTIRRNSIPYKLALATGVKSKGERMFTSDILSLLGKSAQFEISITKNGEFLNDRVKLQGTIPDALVKAGLVQELPKEHQFVITFDELNDENAVKFLPAAIKNQIKKATNYEGSVIQQQLEANEKPQNTSEGGNQGGSTPEPQKAPESDSAQPEKVSEPTFDDSDIPF